MSSNVNTVLAECERQAGQLIEEIAKYRAAGAISEQTSKSLKALCDSLTETQKRIEPFTRVFAKRVLIVAGGVIALNTILLGAILVVLLTR